MTRLALLVIRLATPPTRARMGGRRHGRGAGANPRRERRACCAAMAAAGDVARPRKCTTTSACGVPGLGGGRRARHQQRRRSRARFLPGHPLHAAAAGPRAGIYGDRRRHARARHRRQYGDLRRRQRRAAQAAAVRRRRAADARAHAGAGARAPRRLQRVRLVVPEVPDVHRVATGVRRDRVLRGPRPRSLRRRRAAARARRSRHGTVSVRPRRRAVDGTPVHLGRGAQGRHAARRDDQPRLVDAALRRRSGRGRPDDSHQCDAVHRDRRAAAGLPRSDWQRRRLGAARRLRALAADPGAVALVHDRRPPQARRVGARRPRPRWRSSAVRSTPRIRARTSAWRDGRRAPTPCTRRASIPTSAGRRWCCSARSASCC